MLRITVAIGIALFLIGCASVLNEDKQTVSVRAVCYGMSMPAQCVAENSRGRWTFNAPKQIQVSKDMFDLKVTCKSAFLDKHAVSAHSGVQVAMAGNVLLGGLVGSAVDVATARGLQYPAQIDVVYPSCK